MIALLTWPIVSPIPGSGPDASWVAGLYMAPAKGLQFGTEFVFAYGPLGFLEQPVLYDGALWVIAILYRALIYVALACALVRVGRRGMPLLLAAALVYAILVVGYLEAAAVLLAFVVCVAALSEQPPRGSPYLIAVGGGVLGAVEVLAKLNFGLAVLALCLIALLGLPDRRRLVPLYIGVASVVTLVLWLLAGQSLANLPEFASHQAQVLAGYSSAMTTDVSDVSWQRPWAVAAILLLLGGALFATRNDPASKRLATVALVVTFGFVMFKQSFVRQGFGNATDFFPLLLGAALAFVGRLPRRISPLPPYAPALLLLGPFAVLAIAGLPSPSLWESLQPRDHLDFLRQDLRAFSSATERRHIAAEGRSRMDSTYRIDPKTLAMLRGRTVDVEPWEIGAAWAYRLDWQPLPIIQGYQAYTPQLDELNADALASPRRPTAILRQNTNSLSGVSDRSIDDRYIAWDPPAASRQMLCRYRPVRTTNRWQVLHPAADRCGRERLLARIHIETGAAVAVPSPPPKNIVFARIHGLGVEGFEAARTFFYRARERFATLNGHDQWRVVPATAEDGLILRSDPAIDFPAPFQLAPQARTVSLTIAGAEREIEVDFFAQAVKGAR